MEPNTFWVHLSRPKLLSKNVWKVLLWWITICTMLRRHNKQYISFNIKSQKFPVWLQRPMKNLIELFFNTENIPHNSTILHEIRCFFGSFDYLQNQSLVRKISRRIVKLMFESIWICYSSHCVSSLPLSKIPAVDWFTGNT